MNLFSEPTSHAPGPGYFERLAEALPGIIWIARTDGSIEYINSEGHEFTGRPPDEDLDWGWWGLMHPDDLGRAQSEWQGAMAEGRPLLGTWRIKRKDGEYRWLQARARPLSNSHGVIEKWFGLSVDITPEIELQDELRDSERIASEALTTLETLQSSTPVGFGYIDTDYRYVRVNWTLAEMHGLPLVEHPGKLVSDVVPQIWDQVEPVLAEVIESGMPARNIDIVGEVPGVPGETRHFLLNSHPTTMNDKITGVGIVVVDITDRFRADEFKSAVLADMNEGVYAIDMDGKITFVNRAALAMTGYEEKDVTGKDAHDLLHYQHADGSRFLKEDCELYQARMSGVPKRGTQTPVTRKDGSIFPAAYSLAPLKTGETMFGAVIVFRDTTAEQETQARLQRELNELTWVGRVRDALDEGRFVIFSQPIYPLKGGEMTQELLIRMIGRNGEIVPPISFLPMAEKYGMILEIDRFVIGEAIKLAATGERLQLNLSAASLGQTELIDLIRDKVEEAGVDPGLIVFEITETSLVQELDRGRAFLEDLHELGFGVALDDFGTGFGSLTYLKRLPLDFLKIDVDFVKDLKDNSANQHLVKAIVNLAQGFGQQTVAEGVEDAETLEMLKEYDVDFAQGFHLGRPEPLDPQDVERAANASAADTSV